MGEPKPQCKQNVRSEACIHPRNFRSVWGCPVTVSSRLGYLLVTTGSVTRGMGCCHMRHQWQNDSFCPKTGTGVWTSPRINPNASVCILTRIVGRSPITPVIISGMQGCKSHWPVQSYTENVRQKSLLVSIYNPFPLYQYKCHPSQPQPTPALLKRWGLFGTFAFFFLYFLVTRTEQRTGVKKERVAVVHSQQIEEEDF